jgi:hypothetical protein
VHQTPIFLSFKRQKAFLPSSTYQRMALLAKMQMYLFVKDVSINEDYYSDNRLITTITAMGMTAKRVLPCGDVSFVRQSLAPF